MQVEDNKSFDAQLEEIQTSCLYFLEEELAVNRATAR